MASVAMTAPGRNASGWIARLVLFGLASTVEAFYVSHVLRFRAAVLGVWKISGAPNAAPATLRAGPLPRWLESGSGYVPISVSACLRRVAAQIARDLTVGSVHLDPTLAHGAIGVLEDE